MRTLVTWVVVLLAAPAWSIGLLLASGATDVFADSRGHTGTGNICWGRLPASFSAESRLLFEDAESLPYIFVFTHYEFIGDPAHPEGVIYHPTGQPYADAADGSRIVLTGRGGWDPATREAGGGGQYTITNAQGAVTAQGAWRVTSFISFDLLVLDDWWGIPGFREEGWEGGPDAVSFSGFLTVNVNLDNLGDGVMRAWCLMPTASMTETHVGDGVSLVGDNFNFGGSAQAEMSMFDNSEGVMFYSTDPNAHGWVLNPAGIAVARDQGLQGFQPPTGPDRNGYNPQ